MSESTGPRGGGGCSLLMAGYGMTAVALMVFLVASQLASSQMGWTRRGWEATLGSLDELVVRFPERQANEAALRIETLGTALGIDLAPHHLENREHPDRSAAAAFKAIRAVLGRYVDGELRRPQRGSLAAPPEEIEAFLVVHRDDIAAVRRVLTEGAPPAWEQNLHRGHAAPMPNLLGQIDLQRLLIGSALGDIVSGRAEQAETTLEASWRLNESLRGSPLLICQQVAGVAATAQAGALRHLGDVPEHWVDRLQPRDFREPLIAAMKYDGWLQAQFESWNMVGDGGGLSSLVAFAARPYAGLCLSASSDAYRSRLDRLSSLPILCDDDLSLQGASLEIPVAPWNRLGRSFIPDYAGVVSRLARIELDLELTRKILELDLERRANEGCWPAELPGIEDSTVCPHDRWRYHVAPDGSVSLSFSRDIAWPKIGGLQLPTRFVSER